MIHSEAEQVRHIIVSGWRISLMVTGAGGSLVQSMLSQAGASQCLRHISVPYSNDALRDALLEEPASSVSQGVATRMARRALETMEACGSGGNYLAVGLTAAIGTNRERHGKEQFFATIIGRDLLSELHGQFEKGVLEREQQEAVIRQMLLQRISVWCGLEVDVMSSSPGFTLIYDREHERPEDGLAGLVDGASGYVVLDEDGRMKIDPLLQRPVLLPGSFRPLHAGHSGMVAAAEKTLKHRVCFELSVENVDKSPLDLVDVRTRLRQIAWMRPVVITRAPRFLDKARLFPGGLFVVGFDTAMRLVDPAYYDGVEAMKEALAEIQSQGCRFLVAGRQQDGLFRTLADVDVPGAFTGLFEAIPERTFRHDISSTDIRADSGVRIP